MKFSKTVKLRIVPKEKDIEALHLHLELFRKASNYVSQFLFDQEFCNFNTEYMQKKPLSFD